MTIKGGYPFYGQSIGILLNATKAPLLPGNVGNASTYRFPVRIKSIKELPSDWWCDEKGPDNDRLQAFIKAAQGLEKEGVRAITTGCGFYAIFQKKAAPYLKVPLFTSPLLMIPMVWRMTGQKGKIGVLTAGEAYLGREHFEAVGVNSDIPLAIKGMDNYQEFQEVIVKETKLTADVDRLRAEVVDAARQLVKENPDIRAVILECSDMPPFAKEILETIQRPVFDFINLINLVHDAVLPRRYSGHM